ncbi:putative transcription factor C2C2-CO-like family [Helianthus annuus]|uniref:Transcription factor C2C2-CO-like family n=3 Tax=Helianthus annuus TaxID=4232 RepID=A0A9K3J254_HELAN|nr:zinc finger protein HD1-like [Helianthus annuus]KAF5807358.1 putative transcription factor C2C2-CO-like family [Helianthus annuus]KAJ0924113.1 putative transcription factor C2C2-CO-like family [Helianthus annuus]
MQTQGIQTSLLPMVAGIVPEATIGTADLPPEWAPNQFSFPPSYPGNLIKEAVGTYSNSTSMSSVGTQQQISPDDLQKPYEHPPMTRQDRILRYFEKKKARKYQKKVIYSSRKTYAQTRPRIRGRFARSSQTDASDKTAV